MVRSWAWLGLCLGLTSTAFAESAVPQVRVRVPGEIPSGGVLPIFGSCYDARCSALQSAVVTDVASGTSVEGVITIEHEGSSYDSWAYFVPRVPFADGGSFRVTIPGYATASAMFSVRGAAPAQLGASAVSTGWSLGKEQVPSQFECCASSPSNCFTVEWSNVASLLVTLSPEEPVATQYVYELSVRAQEDAKSEVLAAFRPLPPDTRNIPFSHSFDGASKSYCYTLRARPLVGGEPFEVMSQCVANDFTGYGKEPRVPAEIAEARADCERSHADAAVSSGLVDAAVDGDGEELGRGEDKKIKEDSGCQLADGGPQAGWLIALAALARRRRAT